MADKNTPGDKKLSVPSKTLTLKPRVETGTVRQSFPHGRSKQVVVETKRGKRRSDAQAEVPHAPEPAVHHESRPSRRTSQSEDGRRAPSVSQTPLHGKDPLQPGAPHV